MLRDQIFIPPIEVAVGPELFYGNNALKLDLATARIFQKLPVELFGIRFSFVADRAYRANPVQMLDQLTSMGIAIANSIIFDASTSQSFLRDSLQFFDVLFCPETLKNTPQVRGLYVQDKGSFLASLDRLRLSMIAPSVESFK